MKNACFRCRPGLGSGHNNGKLCQGCVSSANLTKREWYVGQALEAVRAMPWHPDMGWGPDLSSEQVAEIAIADADAVLKALAETGEEQER